MKSLLINACLAIAACSTVDGRTVPIPDDQPLSASESRRDVCPTLQISKEKLNDIKSTGASKVVMFRMAISDLDARLACEYQKD
jgi:hypothetical protein